MFRKAAIAVLALALSGCMAGKASHQNGFVLIVTETGRVAVGYGETEDVPAGCVFLRMTETVAPSFWGSGTNIARAATYWDTRGMATNVCARAAD